jgi:hypothetical protein
MSSQGSEPNASLGNDGNNGRRCNDSLIQDSLLNISTVTAVDRLEKLDSHISQKTSSNTNLNRMEYCAQMKQQLQQKIRAVQEEEQRIENELKDTKSRSLVLQEKIFEERTSGQEKKKNSRIRYQLYRQSTGVNWDSKDFVKARRESFAAREDGKSNSNSRSNNGGKDLFKGYICLRNIAAFEFSRDSAGPELANKLWKKIEDCV